MGFETQEIPEVAQDIYQLARDGELSVSEEQDLLARYESQKEQIVSETQSDLAELRDFIDIFQSVETLSQEQKIQLQMILSLPRSERDGVFWPGTFQKFLAFRRENSFSWTPQELLQVYDQEKSNFEWLSLDEKKALQPEWWKDGIWGQQTFRFILSQKSGETLWESDSETETEIQETHSAHIPGDQHPEEIITRSEAEMLSPVSQDSISPELQSARIPGDQHPEEIIEIEEPAWENIESLDEKKSRFQAEAREYQRVLLRQLQEHLGEIPVDGSFWPLSVERLLEVYPQIENMAQAFELAAINTDIDGILTNNGDPEVFRNLYGEYIKQLGNDLGLPLWFIEAIIKQETNYGTDLVSHTGSHGLMQLTRWPFKDMRGDSGDRIGVSSETVLRYQEIFQRIDLDALLQVEIGDRWQAQDRMPAEVIEALRTIQSSQDIPEIQEKITFLYEYLKLSGDDFHDHEANMIIGSVYLASLYERYDQNIEITAREYNSSPNEMRAYGRNVERFFEEIVAEQSQAQSLSS